MLALQAPQQVQLATQGTWTPPRASRSGQSCQHVGMRPQLASRDSQAHAGASMEVREALSVGLRAGLQHMIRAQPI